MKKIFVNVRPEEKGHYESYDDVSDADLKIKKESKIIGLTYRIKNKLIEYKPFAIETIKKNNMAEYPTIIDKGTDICEDILELILIARTDFTVKNGYVINYSPLDEKIPIILFCTISNICIVPYEARSFLESIMKYKNISLTQFILDNNTVLEFTMAFDYFFTWFYKYANEEGICKLDENWGKLAKLLVNEEVADKYTQKGFEKISEKLMDIDVKVTSTSDAVIELNDTLKEVQKQLSEISGSITSCQSLVTRYLEKSDVHDDDDVRMNEKLIQTFVDECAERIIKSTELSIKNQKYVGEKNKLINSIGQSAWNKLDDSSKTFLITSKVMFSDLSEIPGQTDFSGVCILVTKALEVEMKRRFYYGFLDFLDEKYHADYSRYPTFLVTHNRKKTKYFLRNENQFTMGSIAYALCVKENKYDDDMQIENNKKILADYVKAGLMHDKTENETLSILYEYGEEIENIKNRYRDKSAHTNQLTKIDARKCFDLVIDTEELLRRMLDSFDW